MYNFLHSFSLEDLFRSSFKNKENKSKIADFVASLKISFLAKQKTFLRKLLRKLYPFLHVQLRRKLYLMGCDLQNKSGFMDAVEITIASSFEDYDAAFALVHKTYIDCGYIDEGAQKVRVRVCDLLPNTAVLVAKLGGKVIGTVTLIIDSQYGLPMEINCAEEIAAIRKEGGIPAEISSVAILKEYRQNGLLLHLGHTAERYALEAGCSDICVAVSPYIASFYRDILLYKQEGPIRSYSNERYDPVVVMRKNCRSNIRNLEITYAGMSAKYNLHSVPKNLQADNKKLQSLREHARKSKNDQTILRKFLNTYRLTPAVTQYIQAVVEPKIHEL